MKQLIVLGNGFDIHCGLRSRYSDFFLDRFKTLFCKDKDNAKQIDELEDDLSKKRSEILSLISDVRSRLNFPQVIIMIVTILNTVKRSSFQKKATLLDGTYSFFLQMFVWTKV